MSATATIYVIPGSHACRTGMLLLDHKGIDYRVVELPTGLHPQLVRLLGFPGRSAGRTLDGRTNPLLASMDRFGTVPAVRIDGARVQTNLALIDWLEEHHPQPPLFPAGEDRRREVTEALRWGDAVLQMAARRLVFAVALRGSGELQAGGAEGRLGPLLSRSALMRSMVSQVAGRVVFRAKPAREQPLREAMRGYYDRIDAWIGAGVLGSEQLSAADLMIVSSLALLAYIPDQRDEILRRPCGALLERVLPEPRVPTGAATAGAAAGAAGRVPS